MAGGTPPWRVRLVIQRRFGRILLSALLDARKDTSPGSRERRGGWAYRPAAATARPTAFGALAPRGPKVLLRLTHPSICTGLQGCTAGAGSSNSRGRRASIAVLVLPPARRTTGWASGPGASLVWPFRPSGRILRPERRARDARQVHWGGDEIMADDTPQQVTLARKIDALFRAPGREYTYAEVAEGIRRQGGPTSAATQLWELRHGVKANPRIAHLAALATFFGVPTRYFLADDDLGADLDAKLQQLHALRDPQVERLALRASGLSPRTLRAIAAIVERAREIEGLQDGDAAPEDQAGAGAAAGRAGPAAPDA